MSYLYNVGHYSVKCFSNLNYRSSFGSDHRALATHDHIMDHQDSLNSVFKILTTADCEHHRISKMVALVGSLLCGVLGFTCISYCCIFNVMISFYTFVHSFLHHIVRRTLLLDDVYMLCVYFFLTSPVSSCWIPCSLRA